MAAPLNRLKTCPPVYEQRILQAGGINRYGEPNFRLDWGERYTVRRGGVWDSGDYYFKGYRDVLEDGRPCWVVRQWNPPEFYGCPLLWFRDSYDPKSGLSLLGDFPYRGQYEAVQPLVWRGLVNGRLVVETMPLNGMIVDILIPMIKHWKTVQSWRKELAFKNWQERKERDFDKKLEDARQGAKVAFGGPVSYARQPCRTWVVDKRMKAIEEHWEQAAQMLRRQGLGITIH